MDQVEFADLGRLGNVLKNSKAMMDNTKMPVQNKQVQESINKTNIGHASDMDLTEEREMPDLVGDYYARMSGSNKPKSSGNDLFNFNEQTLTNSKLPKAVQDIMRESQKIRNVALPNDLPEELVREVNKDYGKIRKQNINENITTNNAGVDYSLIKTIVEDCMKKYVSTIKKSLINESKNSSLELMTQNGNTFKFVTTDGKVFEGELIYKGKIK